MNNWTFKPTKEKQDAYEEIISKLNPCSPEEFNQHSSEEQNKIILDMIKEIRKINQFPIYYFNEDGIKKEIKKAIDKTVCFSDGVLDLSYAQGLLLLDYLFPNLHKVNAGEKTNKSMYDRFYDDEILGICLKNAISNRKILNMRTTFFTYARFLWRTAINYSPMRAKAIYEKFCPNGGVIYDYSAGFGGRMLGALSSKNNYTYIGIDPNTETYENLLRLGEYIEKVTGREGTYDIYNVCSEDVILEPESIDFAFSCPPYFTLEQYCDEETQSINKFPKYEDWLEYYVRPTIKSIYQGLKPDGIFGVNIVNFWIGAKKYMITEDWIKIAQEEGFVLQNIYSIVSKARKKMKEDQDSIYIFTKEGCKLADYTDENTINFWNKKLKEKQEQKDKQNKTIAQYDIFGNLLNIYKDFNDIEEFTKEEVKNAIKTKKIIKNFYFRQYNMTEQCLKNIKIKKPICQIDDIYFFTYAEAGRYLNTPRQTIAQACSRQSKKILNHEVIWIEKD